MNKEIEARVRKVIAESLGVDESRVTPEATLTDLGADSLDEVELVMALEDEFGCAISDDEAHKLKSIKDAVSLMEAKNTSAAAA